MKAVFLDRDGTINVDKEYVFRKEDLEWEKNVIPGLRLLQENGFELIILTNHSGIARGYFTEEDFRNFNDFLVEELGKEGIIVRKTYFCPFHPTKGIGKYRVDSPLRKPGAGMLEEADREFGIEKEKSFLVGDRWSDVLAGKNFGIRSVLVSRGKAGSDEEHRTEADFVAKDFLEAAKFIVDNKYEK